MPILLEDCKESRLAEAEDQNILPTTEEKWVCYTCEYSATGGLRGFDALINFPFVQDGTNIGPFSGFVYLSTPRTEINNICTHFMSYYYDSCTLLLHSIRRLELFKSFLN